MDIIAVVRREGDKEEEDSRGEGGGRRSKTSEIIDITLQRGVRGE
jgi:hypothetical protein